jgi:hypothetical protein
LTNAISRRPGGGLTPKGSAASESHSTRVKARLRVLASALERHQVGLAENGDGVWSLYIGAALLGKIDERTMQVHG